MTDTINLKLRIQPHELNQPSDSLTPTYKTGGDFAIENRLFARLFADYNIYIKNLDQLTKDWTTDLLNEFSSLVGQYNLLHGRNIHPNGLQKFAWWRKKKVFMNALGHALHYSQSLAQSLQAIQQECYKLVTDLLGAIQQNYGE